jgi:hypothetical protein
VCAQLLPHRTEQKMRRINSSSQDTTALQPSVFLTSNVSVAGHKLTSLCETAAKVKVELPSNECRILCAVVWLADTVAFPALISSFLNDIHLHFRHDITRESGYSIAKLLAKYEDFCDSYDKSWVPPVACWQTKDDVKTRLRVLIFLQYGFKRLM